MQRSDVKVSMGLLGLCMLCYFNYYYAVFSSNIKYYISKNLITTCRRPLPIHWSPSLTVFSLSC